MHTSIDGLVAELDQKYGFTPALAELALSDIYQDIRGKAQSVATWARELIQEASPVIVSLCQAR